MKLIKLIVVSAMLMFGAFTANAQGFGGQMDPQEMVKMRVDQMKQNFNLTDAQVKQVTEFYTKQNEEMMKIFESGNPDFSEFGKIMEKEETEIKKIFTDEQFKAWKKQREEMMAQFGGGF